MTPFSLFLAIGFVNSSRDQARRDPNSDDGSCQHDAAIEPCRLPGEFL